MLSIDAVKNTPHSSNGLSNKGYSLYFFEHRALNDWIINYGATDHMTFDPKDFVEVNQPKRACIENANRVTYPVIGADKVALSLSFSLPNTLLAPSLSNKLLSVGQATEKLNCCALIYPKFCLFQDILTNEIIGHGTKRGGVIVHG